MTIGSRPAETNSDFPWPLTFDWFAFGTRAYNTLNCSVTFCDRQFALTRERNQPSGEPSNPDWKDDWEAGFAVPKDMMPPGPVEIAWTSLDGKEHYAEIDLIKDVFPNQVVLHNVPKDDVNDDWARYEKGKTSPPEILVEVNDRTVNVYMKAHVLTKSFPIPGRTDVKSLMDLILAWTKTF